MAIFRFLSFFVCCFLQTAVENSFTPSPECASVEHEVTQGPVELPCKPANSTRVNFTQWSFYPSIDNYTFRRILHSGTANESKFPGGTVATDRKTALSNLTIEGFWRNNTGKYECVVNYESVSFIAVCYNVTFVSLVDTTPMDSTTLRSLQQENFTTVNLVIYSISGGVLIITISIALTAICYVRKTRKLLSETANADRELGNYQSHLQSPMALHQRKERTERLEMIENGSRPVPPVRNGCVRAEVIQPSQRPVGQQSAVADPTASADNATNEATSREEVVPVYAEIVSTKSGSGRHTHAARNVEPPPTYAQITHHRQTKTFPKRFSKRAQKPVVSGIKNHHAAR